MEIHYKCTIWGRIEIDESKITKEEVLDKLQKGLSLNDIAFPDDDINSEFSVLYDTEEELSVEDNKGKATIELMEYQEGKVGLQCVWNNVDGITDKTQR